MSLRDFVRVIGYEGSWRTVTSALFRRGDTMIRSTMLFFVGLLSTFAAIAEGIDCEQMGGGELVTTDFVILRKDLSVSGRRVCHDGRHIYFKTIEDCQVHNEMMAEHGLSPLTCDNQALAPMKEVERINIPNTDRSIFRFFVVDIYYHSSTQYVTHFCSSEPITEEHIIDTCDPEAHPTQFPETIETTRDASNEESEFLSGLWTAGFNVILSPGGVLNNTLFIEEALWRFDLNSAATSPVIRSPMCDAEFVSYFESMGGEFTGTGRIWDLFDLEDRSAPINERRRGLNGSGGTSRLIRAGGSAPLSFQCGSVDET